MDDARNTRQTRETTRARRRTGVVRLLALTTLVALLASQTGCNSIPDPDATAMEYLTRLRQGKTLDIQVVRRSQRITMTNTTPTNFGPSRLWLNRRFSHAIDSWAIGQTLDIHLSKFVDEFGEGFRPGGFFAAEAPDTIVHAQLETPRIQGLIDDGSVKMLGLVVVPPVE